MNTYFHHIYPPSQEFHFEGSKAPRDLANVTGFMSPLKLILKFNCHYDGIETFKK
jgi:hypothetical protein